MISAKSEKLRDYSAQGNQYKPTNFSDGIKKHCIKSWVRPTQVQPNAEEAKEF